MSITGFEAAKKQGQKKALAMIIDGVQRDLSAEIQDDAEVEFITSNHPAALEIMRHTTAHVMAQAIKTLWPNAKIAIGPTIDDGFYYDISCEHQITPSDFEKIEQTMRSIIAANHKIVREDVSKEKALELFGSLDEPFKVELINSIDSAMVSLYWHDDKFVDLCRGPHLPSTGSVPKHFKLMKIAGAYWRGDSSREMLQRIYATAWFTAEELQQYLHLLEEAEKRDHRRLAKEMDLFHMQEESPGCIFWHPRGWTMYNLLKNYVSERIKEDGYVEVCTPQLVDRSLWEASGHWEKYRENMFIAESENRILAVKPMNCPGGVQIFKYGIKSYRDLPLRMAEFGYCHRNEPSGSLYGTMRVRGFTQDDAHIFCTPDQLTAETKKFCQLLGRIYKELGFEQFSVKFSDRPEKRCGSDEVWDLAESMLQQAAKEAGLEYSYNKGEGAFYGPKLEFVLRDKLGREWQCGTLQVDFQMPEKLDATYIGEDGNKHHPIMLHRAVLGSLERFVGIMLEHYAGHLPLWLAPVQIVVATISQDYNDYAQEVHGLLAKHNLRANLDLRSEKISYKIREHTLKKVPYIAIIGAKEQSEGLVTLRRPNGEQWSFTREQLLDKLCTEGRVPNILNNS